MSTACHEAGLARKRVLGKSRSISLVARYASYEILQEPSDSSALSDRMKKYWAARRSAKN